MENKNGLDDILIEPRGKDSQSKKILLILLASFILLVVLLVAIFALTRDNKPEKINISQIDNTIEKLDEPQVFENMPIKTESQSEEDRFEKIVKDIKSKQEAVMPPPPPQTPQKEEKSEPLALQKLQDTKEKVVVETKPKPISTPKPKTEEKVKPEVKKVKETKKKDSSAADAFRNIKSDPQKGHYLQVGAFSKTPNKDFLQKIKKYNYTTKKIESNGKEVTKYLIGPFKSRNEADQKAQDIGKEMGKPVYIEIK